MSAATSSAGVDAPVSLRRDEPPLLGGRMGPTAVPLKIERAKDTRTTVWRVWGYLRRQRAALLLAAVMVVLSSALSVLGPYLLGVAIDRYILPGDVGGLAGTVCRADGGVRRQLGGDVGAELHHGGGGAASGAGHPAGPV